jgi:hypothetical protein
LVLGIVRLRRAQQISAERTARLERDAEADLEAVRGFERGDEAGLPLRAFDRPLAEPEDVAGILIAGSLPQRQASSCGNVMIKDSACSMGISNLTAVPETSRNSSPTSAPSAATRQVVSFSLRIFTIAGPLLARFADQLAIYNGI